VLTLEDFWVALDWVMVCEREIEEDLVCWLEEVMEVDMDDEVCDFWACACA